MVQDYTRDFYIPCIDRVRQINNSNYEFVRNIAIWKEKIMVNWPNVRILADKDGANLREQHTRSGENIVLNALCQAAYPDDVSVEVYGQVVNSTIRQGECIEMKASASWTA